MTLNNKKIQQEKIFLNTLNLFSSSLTSLRNISLNMDPQDISVGQNQENSTSQPLNVAASTNGENSDQSESLDINDGESAAESSSTSDQKKSTEAQQG